MANNNDERDERPDDYVGYGRPPKEHRFRKGNKANPNGRKGKPKKTHILDRRQRHFIDGRWQWLTGDDLMDRALFAEALKGNVSAVTKLEKRRAEREAQTDDSAACEEERQAAEFMARIVAQRGSRPEIDDSGEEDSDDAP